jgi:hypothetical protein
MKPIVLDTDVVSFLFKGDTRAQIFLPHLENRQWLVSLARFAIVPSSRDLVLKWAEVMVQPDVGAVESRRPTLDRSNRPSVRLFLLTHNRADYLGVPGLRLLD